MSVYLAGSSGDSLEVNKEGPVRTPIDGCHAAELDVSGSLGNATHC